MQTSINAVTGIDKVQLGTPVITANAKIATTSGTSVPLTGIPSWVKKITMTWDGVSTNGGSNMLVQLGSSAGYVTSGYAGSGALGSNASAFSTQAYTLGFGNLFGAASNFVIDTATFVLHDAATNRWVCSMVLVTDTAIVGFSAGVITLPGVLDRLRLTTVNGTDVFDAGSFNTLMEG